MKSTYTNIEDLPLTLNAREAAGVLRISKSKVYELARTESFPAIRIGNRVVIPRDKLIEWMNTQAQIRGYYEKRDKGGIPAGAGYLRNTPPGNAVRGFYEVSQVLPFPGCTRK